MYARVLIDLVEARIDADRRQYQVWSTRARLQRIHLSGPRVERKYVRRATPGPFTLSVRREMDRLIQDMRHADTDMRTFAEFKSQEGVRRSRFWSWWANARFLAGWGRR